MSRLIEAAQRLRAATDALERAASERSAAAGTPSPEFHAELERTRRENESLTATAEQVSGRLDRAIKRIQTLLET